MPPEFKDWLPIIMAVLGMVGGGWGLFLKAKEQAIKERSTETDKDAALLEFAKDYQIENKALKDKIAYLESEVARIPALEAAIHSLESQLKLLIGGSAYAVEGDYESFRG